MTVSYIVATTTSISTTTPYSITFQSRLAFDHMRLDLITAPEISNYDFNLCLDRTHRQTDRQTDYCNPLAHAQRVNKNKYKMYCDCHHVFNTRSELNLKSNIEEASLLSHALTWLTTYYFFIIFLFFPR